MNYWDKHIGDFLKDTITLSMMQEGAYNRLLDQYYQSEAPLPVKEIYKLARADGAKEKQAVDHVLTKFFTKTEHGFVQKRAQEVIEKYWDSESESEVKKDNQNERQRRSRERRKALFDALRELGVTPAFNTKTAELSRMLSRVTGGDCNGDVTGDITANQPPLPITHYPIKEPNTASDDSQVVGTGTTSPTATPGLISKTCREHGVLTQPADPRVIAFSEQGVSLDTIAAACKAAREAKPTESIGIGYVAAILTRWANEAKTLNVKGAGKAQREDTSWRKTPQGIEAKGNSLGMRAARNEDHWQYADRIAAEILKRKSKPDDGGVPA